MARIPMLIASLFGSATPALAQQPRVPVPVYGSEMPGCSTAYVYNLEGTDGFLAVRAGPGRRERQLARLRDRDPVFACVRDGDWFGIVFSQGGAAADCGVSTPRPRTAPYRGPCRSGWVHQRYLGGYADYISP